MAWFLVLQGTPNKTGQSLNYELHESARIEQIAEEMAGSAAIDRAVAIPTVFNNRPRPVTVYVRPAAWGAWAFYEMSDEERRKMLAANVNAIAQAAKQKQAQQPQQSQQQGGQQQRGQQQGPSVVTLPRLDSNQQPFG